MWGFLFGVIVGAAGYWAYNRVMGDMGMGDIEQSRGSGSSIYRPTNAEVPGRPSEPIPAPDAPPAGAERPGA